jgi:hypothetical protein
MQATRFGMVAFSLMALSLAQAPAHAFTEDKGSRVNRLINEDGDKSAPDHGPKVSDPTAKALDEKPAFKGKIAPELVSELSYVVSSTDDRLVLEPESEAPLNGGIKLD